MFWVCFALLKCCVWYVDLGRYGKETSPGDGNWERGESLERVYPDAPSALSAEELLASASHCRYTETSPPCPELLPWFILQPADSPDARLYSLRTAGNWPAAYRCEPFFLGGWLVRADHHFFHTRRVMPFTPGPKYFVNLSCPIPQDFLSNASSVLELEPAGLVC